MNEIVVPLVSFLLVYIGYQKYDAGYYRCSQTTHFFGILFPIFILYVIWGLKKQCVDDLNKNILMFLSWSMLFFHLLYENDKKS